MKIKFFIFILIQFFLNFVGQTELVSAAEDSYFNCQTIANLGLKKGEKCFCPSDFKEIKVFNCASKQCPKSDVSFFCKSGIMPGQ